MSAPSKIEIALSKIDDTQVIDVSNDTNKKMNKPSSMRKKFGVYDPEIAKDFNLAPLPIVSNNLQSYQNAIYTLNLSNGQEYINAWMDLSTAGNIRTQKASWSPLEQKSELENLRHELKLTDKYLNDTITDNELMQLQNLKDNRLHTTSKEFVSDEIEKLMGEGKSQKQAVAIALSEARRAGLNVTPKKY